MNPVPVRLLLAGTNEQLQRLGYLGMDERQLTALVHTLPDYLAWLEDCITNERASSFWTPLRAAQFAVSQPCAQAFLRAGVQPSLEQAITVVVEQEQVRAALVSLFKAPSEAPPISALTTVRRAFRTAPTTGTTLPPAAIAAAAAHDRSKWPVHKVHGARFAVAVERTSGRDGRAALQVEAAERLPNSKAWDWQAKIVIQLKDPEVIEFLGVLQGRARRAVFAHHGDHRDKSLELAAQPDKQNFMLAVRQGDIARAVPVPASHAFSLSTLALQVLCANAPGLSAADVLAMVGTQPFPTAP